MNKITCRCCGVSKLEEFFYFRKDNGKFRTECKVCLNARAAKWSEDNREKSNAIKKAYDVRNLEKVRACRSAYKKANRPKINAQTQAWRALNVERCRAYGRTGYARNAEASRARARAWYSRNREYALQWATEYAKRHHVRLRISARRKERTQSDAAYAINQRMRGRLRQTLMNVGGKGGRSWTSLVGYTAPELHRHLEAQFVKGMSWSNMSLWEIDHIVPLALHEILEVGDSEFMAAWSLSNLRPAWRAVNRSKSAKWLFLL